MQRLPREIKTMIFRHFLHQSFAHGMALLSPYLVYRHNRLKEATPDPMPFLCAVYYIAAVCQDWRRIVQGTPSLWTTVIFPLFDNRAAGHHRMFLRSVNEHLLRSRTAPLDVYIASFFGTANADMFQPLMDHRKRITSLAILPNTADAWRTSPASLFRSVQFPNLAHVTMGAREWHSYPFTVVTQASSFTLILQTASVLFTPFPPHSNIAHLVIIILVDYGKEFVSGTAMAIQWALNMISESLPNLRSLEIYFPSKLVPMFTNDLHLLRTNYKEVGLNCLTSAVFHGYDYPPNDDHTVYPTFLSHAKKDTGLHPGVVQSVTALLAASECSLSTLKLTLPPSTGIPLLLQPRITFLRNLTLCADAGRSSAVNQLCDPAFLPILEELRLIVLDNGCRLGFDSMANIRKLLESRHLLRMTADTSAKESELKGYMTFIIENGVTGFFSFSCENGLNATLDTKQKMIRYP